MQALSSKELLQKIQNPYLSLAEFVIEPYKAGNFSDWHKNALATIQMQKTSLYEYSSLLEKIRCWVTETESFLK